jgi:hypothetical protein
MNVRIETCEFVRASEIVPDMPWEEISESAPFTWGGNDRSLVAASRLADHCMDILDDTEEKRELVKNLRELGETYIDLEN